jgi:catechol 2,3-dioxygenase-like lactoylglutathione lyase family enzyme
MGVKAIDHWVLVVKDVDRTLDFYRRLGLETSYQERTGGAPPRPIIRISPVQKINLYAAHLYETESPGGAPNITPGTGDFCLHWDGTVPEVLAFLKRSGIPVTGGPISRVGARGPATSVYVRDPDDNVVELMVYEQGR